MMNATWSYAILPVLFFGGCALTTPSKDYQRIYEPTPSGEFSIKTIPPSRQIVAERGVDYFAEADSLFRLLFRYIRQKDVSMTVPVEGGVEKSVMSFYVAGKDLEKNLDVAENVRVVNLPERVVATHGARGSYRRSNIEEARKNLEKWLETQLLYKKRGDAYAVFWDAPFVPWFLKRFEVHIPVEKVGMAPPVNETVPGR